MMARARLRILLVGKPDACFRYCVLSTGSGLASGKNLGPEDIMSGLPRDEWLIHVQVEIGVRKVTAELILEIHGPWVWDLYDVIPPREYFERYTGVIMVGDIGQTDSLRDLARFIQVFDSYGSCPIPAVLVYDLSGHHARDDLNHARQMFSPRFVRIVGVNFATGEGAVKALLWIASKVLGSG